MAKKPRIPQNIQRPNLKASISEQRMTAQVSHTQLHVHEGPIPPPHLLNDYEVVLPGAAERIVQMAEAQANHRHKMEEKALDANIKAQQSQLETNRIEIDATAKMAKRGQISGFIVSIASLTAGVILSMHGSDVLGGAAIAIPSAGLIRAFFFSPDLKNKEKNKTS